MYFSKKKDMTARQKRLREWSEAVNGLKFTKGECRKSREQLRQVYKSAPLEERKWCRVDLETKGIDKNLVSL